MLAALSNWWIYSIGRILEGSASCLLSASNFVWYCYTISQMRIKPSSPYKLSSLNTSIFNRLIKAETSHLADSGHVRPDYNCIFFLIISQWLLSSSLLGLPICNTPT